MPLVEEYKALSSFKEFAAKIAEYEMAGSRMLYFDVAPDFMNAKMNVLWADATWNHFTRYDLL